MAGKALGGHRPVQPNSDNSTPVVLNVQGVVFKTTLGTLRKHPESLLGVMFSGRHAATGMVTPASDGSYPLDRDPVLFSVILGLLETGVYNYSQPRIYIFAFHETLDQFSMASGHTMCC